MADLYEDPRNAWMETASGLRFNYAVLDETQVSIDDVAHALSRMCRYGGHVRDYYTVAEHCVLLCRFVRARGGLEVEQRVALMHDAGEAYLQDVVRPGKHRLKDYMALEKRVDELVAGVFGVSYPFPAWLKELDTRILKDERAQVMNRSGNTWAIDGLEPLGVRCRGWGRWVAKQMFLLEWDLVNFRRPPLWRTALARLV